MTYASFARPPSVMFMSLSWFGYLFDTKKYPPRWFCGEWTCLEGWLYIAAQALIFTAYFTIPFMIYLFVKNKANLYFRDVYLWFFLFILTCGLTHFNEIIIFWWPIYRFNGLMLFFTGIVSWVAVYKLYKIIPEAKRLKSPKDLEKQVEERTELLSKSLIQLQKNTEMLMLKNRQLEEYNYIISHNFRSPITSIKSLLFIYKESQKEEEKDIVVSKLDEVTDKLLGTVEVMRQVLTLRGGEVIQAERIDVEKELNEQLMLVDQELKDIDALLEIDFKKWKEVTFPKVFMESVLSNLISNALKYRKKRERLLLTIKASYTSDGYKRLTFEDNGIGLDLKKHGNKVFGIFKTFHGNADAKGVGLFMTKQHIESQGGNITLESEEGVGMKVIIDFKN